MGAAGRVELAGMKQSSTGGAKAEDYWLTRLTGWIADWLIFDRLLARISAGSAIFFFSRDTTQLVPACLLVGVCTLYTPSIRLSTT